MLNASTLKNLYFNVTLFKTTGSINSCGSRELVRKVRVGGTTEPSIHTGRRLPRCVRKYAVSGRENNKVRIKFDLIFRVLLPLIELSAHWFQS